MAMSVYHKELAVELGFESLPTCTSHVVGWVPMNCTSFKVIGKGVVSCSWAYNKR